MSSSPQTPPVTAEAQRLSAQNEGRENWRQWGPYLAARQWGTVREDYSAGGDAWSYFPHDHARSRAYRWGEDGLCGISDDAQRLCLGLALWNGHDPILKERLFGLTNQEGNHGEDVKEVYHYLDATPTHSYLKMLYKYPHAAFPYEQLVEVNRKRSRQELEYELIDTGVFEANRYFDIFIEYAKAGPQDILMRVSVINRGPDPAPLHVIPQIWFRNTWSWSLDAPRSLLSQPQANCILAECPDPYVGNYHLYYEGLPQVLFTENETNTPRLYGSPAEGTFYKDAFHEYVIHGNVNAVNPSGTGTKAGLHYSTSIPSGGQIIFRTRLSRKILEKPFDDFDSVFDSRIREADEFYADIQAQITSTDEKLVQRQAFAGMIWSKQSYHYDVSRWLDGDLTQPPPPPQRKEGRNSEWFHFHSSEVLSMPDKWEYPWFASWDLAFHMLSFVLIDPAFAKDQLCLLLKVYYQHPNGQIPAYEWNFSDVNPPVHAWSAFRVYQIDRKHNGGTGDVKFLEEIFNKLLLNFTWWVNRKDVHGNNIFEGGFLGLDNIGAFDRSAPLPPGHNLIQADATSWMAMYCLNMMQIALELARHNSVYEEMAIKFFEHFLYIARAMTEESDTHANLWNEEDQFFYDVIHCADGRNIPVRLRSIVGLTPLFAVAVLPADLEERFPNFAKHMEWFLNNKPRMAALVSRWTICGVGERRLLSLLRGQRMKALLRRMLDESEFLSPHGIRALSRYHLDHPFTMDLEGQNFYVKYLPAESDSGLFGGNSNWRGPVWMPMNYLLIESLQKFHYYYGDDFKIECPVGSGKLITLLEAADEISDRLKGIFLKDKEGLRPVFGLYPQIQKDPLFRDHLLFYEYFDGDNGRGVGANHQTGWTGLIAKLIEPRLDTLNEFPSFCEEDTKKINPITRTSIPL